VRLSPLGTAATVWPIVPAPERWWWVWSNRWNANWQRKPKYSYKTCPSATLPTKNPTWPDPGSNPSRRSRKPATNRLSCGTADLSIYLSIYLFMALQPSWTLAPFSVPYSYTQSVGLLGREISPTQDRYLHRTTQTQNKRTQTSKASSGIRTHDPSVRVGKDSSCLRPRRHCERQANDRRPYFFFRKMIHYTPELQQYLHH
jgi:hypothetical protein